MEKYTEEYKARCPRTWKEAVHKIEYAKATCTRVPDTLLHFSCGADRKCKDCQKNYED